jgi:superfamily II DNA or RNA helicase
MEQKIVKIYRAESNLIRLDSVPDDFVSEAIRRYKFAFYEEKACNRCELVDQRHSEPCDNCENYLGTRQLGKIIKKGENKYLSIPMGGTKKFDNLLEAHGLTGKIIAKYGDPASFTRPIRMTREPREWQVEAVEVALKRKRGIIQAPPRAGKTIFGVLLTTRLNVKTLIIASQRDWLTQFRNSYVGSAGEEAFTNLSPRRINFCKTLEDFEKHDVCLCTFQQFMNEGGAKMLAKISRMFGLVIVDEVHFTAALATSRVLSKFSTKYLIGLTGTPARKRQSEEIIFRLLVGPIIYKAKVERLAPTVELIETGCEIQLPKGASKAGFSNWVTRLESDKTRIKLIARYVARAIKQGHSVMVPLARTKSVTLYVKAINHYFPEVVAVPFVGGMKPQVRDQRLADIKSGEYKAVVGNIALLSTGLNIPVLSMLIDRITPTSNIPKAKQRWARVLTPMEGKMTPKVVIVMDECDAQRAMAKNEYWNAIKPEFNPIVSKENQQRLSEWFSKRQGKPRLVDGRPLSL